MSRWKTGMPKRACSRRSSSIFYGAYSTAPDGKHSGRYSCSEDPCCRPSSLESRENRGRDDVLFDLAHPGDVFGGNAHCLPFLVGPVVGEPQVHDPVPDDDVGSPHVNPLLPLQLGDQLLTDRAIVTVSFDCRLALRYCQSPHEVGPADDANELAVANNRHTLD